MTTGLLITALGQAAIIADLGGGANLALTHVAWGDSNGVPYNPNEAQTALVNERYRSTIASVAVVGGAIVVDAIIPADTPDGSARPSHSFNVAEVGLFGADGTLIGVARLGNGYKPPPSSGQASIATFRLKLAVANPSAITVVIDPQAQLIIGRDVRAPWLTVDGVLNDPPAVPGDRATYLIGAAPTGAWTGFANRIAQWVGVWSLASVPVGHHVVDNSKGIDAGARWLERTATGWAPGISRLIQKQPGNYAAAGGTANALTIALDPVPDSWNELIGMPLRIKIATLNTGAATLAVTGLLGTKPIVRGDGTALRRNDFFPGIIIEGIYDGTSVQIGALKSAILGVTTYQTYNVAGSYTLVVPAGLWRIKRARLWGGGAGGGGSTGTGSTAGSGGAPGGFSERFDIPVSPGDSIPVVVGAGGTAGNGGNGGGGGTSSFGSFMSASGGQGGFHGNGVIVQIATTPGDGAGGHLNITSSQGGGIGFAIGASAAGGLGSGAPFGGMTPTLSVGSAGISGLFPGGSGNGGANGNIGGVGAPGAVFLEF